MDNTNEITLTYLSNPLYNTGASNNNLKAKGQELSKDELKFYKKRVYALSREILRGNNTRVSEEVKRAHNDYVRAAIEYFKMLDTEEILQNEYKNIEKEESKQNEQFTCSEFNIQDANNVMFPSTQGVSTLDGFVNSKKVVVNKATNHPQRKRLNLRTDELRVKGIKAKEKKM